MPTGLVLYKNIPTPSFTNLLLNNFVAMSKWFSIYIHFHICKQITSELHVLMAYEVSLPCSLLDLILGQLSPILQFSLFQYNGVILSSSHHPSNLIFSGFITQSFYACCLFSPSSFMFRSQPPWVSRRVSMNRSLGLQLMIILMQSAVIFSSIGLNSFNYIFL
jgi:hypothetical protein